MRGARLRMGPTLEPRRQTIDIDCRGGREVLQARFWEAPVSTLPPPKGTETLRERPCNACPFGILRFPCLCALLLPYGL